ncbi:DNA polymerase [Caulobacter phage Cr30]|uniref:DNA polymerase n=1 Tax=Caulobacter phage Cr30 TaxID=1357714 RepID=UPI0004A9B852|nr:DNA polymerase [Caulobacter phage Cr30]AGS81160.1 DNA polymerase [Caulobacter phage Cr30]
MAKYDLYTSVFQRGDIIYYRGYSETGQRVSARIPYKPYLFIPSKKTSSEFKTLDGKPVDKIEFDSIKEAKEFCKSYEDVDGFEISGNQAFLYPFLNDNHKEDIDYRKDRLKIGYYDLEVDTENGFASVENPWQPITLIGLRINERRMVFGWYDDYIPDEEDGNLEYIKCDNEHDMLLKFLNVWEHEDIDVISGWNIEGYDNTYLVNRLRMLFDEKTANRLSPWGMIDDGKDVDKYGKEIITRTIKGIISADYMRLYRKFTYSQQESYSLNHIAGIELDDYKISYSGSLGDLMRNDYKKFVKYNAQDNDLVYRIDEKMNLLDQALTLSYMTRCTFEDVFGTVKMWDSVFHWKLMKKNIVIPPMKYRSKSEQFAGAYVADIAPGRYKYLASFDVKSLYPSLVIWANLSPETYRGKLPKFYTVDQLLAGKLEEREWLEERNLCLAANMTLWDKEVQGIFAEIMDWALTDRDMFKDKMKKAKQENIRNPAKELQYLIAKCNNMQMALKIFANSGFGAAGTPYFRYFSIELAEAITVTGQLTIRWVSERINKLLNQKFKTKDYNYCVYNDTDSVYVTLEPIVNEIFKDKPNASEKDKIQFMDKVCKQLIEPFLEKCFLELADYLNAYKKDKITMKREALADSGFWLGAKNYVLSVHDNEGVKYDEPDIKMMGIAAVKTSTPAVCREMMKESIRIMLQESQRTLISHINDCKADFMKLPFENVAFPRGVNGLKKYPLINGQVQKGTPIHVKGSLLYNKMLKDKKVDSKYFPITDGEKIKFSYLKTPNPLHEAVIASNGPLPPEFELDEYIDYETQFEKSFVEPIRSMAEAIGWSVEEKADLSSLFD